MNDIDKIIMQLNSVASWLRTAKEDENVRTEMLSAADKTCLKLSAQISALTQNA